MRPDNPNFRPCAIYHHRQWTNQPAVHVGHDAVGEGWGPILDELDHQFVMATGIGTDNHRKIEVLQIKEKFGGLRVYVNATQLTGAERIRVIEAIDRAEEKSFQTCEKCGSTEGVETRANKNGRFSRVVTLCQEHHEERDNLLPGQRLDLGNGNTIV
ncbi:MAG: hypothetical protein GF334_03260 [Candidatus Altiarchaeales archaeon]|nr:hypothetical protein [Candidatus Altiarchaeales archaeon]